ncbi:SpaH/EbpB family LPXTG-anchored major pilin [Lacticaseibacillus hegangensis]|uniref:SpaH/EbpB family LPXTG-anchored major pilin n=1 Tax=Lacticaseibacillus hegangensis TaxID=2486010 RepID=A0ABW4CV07_9LACO|nr:SpaH/EbpB family LPXTG-anchored major pilin [Lacticaseibacillus hegangensis]
MTKATKLTRFTMAGMMVCSMALTTLTSVSAVAPTITSAATTKTGENMSNTLPETVKLKVHKLKFLNADSTPKPNTGAELEFDKATPLKDVTFNIYNIRALVDAQVAELRKGDAQLTEKEAIEQAVKIISQDWSTNKTTWTAAGGGAVSKGTAITGEDGIAVFDDVATKTGSKYDIYLIEEVAGGPDSANGNMFISLPIIAGFPIKNAEGKFYKEVNLYAKNSAVTKEIDNLKEGVSGDGKSYSYEVGEDIRYNASVNIPGNIAEKRADNSYLFKGLTITDTMSTTGTTFKSLDSIMVDGKDVKNEFDAAMNYTPIVGNATDKAGFTYSVDFSNPKDATALETLLKTIAGKHVQFNYTVTLNEFAVPTADIGNDFRITLGDETLIATAPTVEYGGFRFTKVDSNDTNHELSGATFRISQMIDGKIKYAEFDKAPTLTNADGVYKANNIEWTDEGTIFATGSSAGNVGNLEFHGLQSGAYKLHEETAPTGYVKSDTPINFTIVAGHEGTITIGENGVLYDKVLNTPDDGVLPITGSMGIAAFLIVGTAAMGTAVMIKKRRA